MGRWASGLTFSGGRAGGHGTRLVCCGVWKGHEEQ
jgi:hypothetical protein